MLNSTRVELMHKMLAQTQLDLSLCNVASAGERPDGAAFREELRSPIARDRLEPLPSEKNFFPICRWLECWISECRTSRRSRQPTT
jgi:hypothetical protein